MTPRPEGKISRPGVLLAEAPEDAGRAQTLAEEMGLSFVSDPCMTGGEAVWLVLNGDGLALTDGKMAVSADMTSMLPRLRTDRLASELLVRAAGRVKEGEAPLAVDAAAGFGEDAVAHGQVLERLEGIPAAQELNADQTVTIGKPGEEIRVTPYIVDHSAYEAWMLLVETPDKVILHTGDYRGHGYIGKNGKTMLKNFIDLK